MHGNCHLPLQRWRSWTSSAGIGLEQLCFGTGTHPAHLGRQELRTCRPYSDLWVLFVFGSAPSCSCEVCNAELHAELQCGFRTRTDNVNRTYCMPLPVPASASKHLLEACHYVVQVYLPRQDGVRRSTTGSVAQLCYALPKRCNCPYTDALHLDNIRQIDR